MCQVLGKVLRMQRQKTKSLPSRSYEASGETGTNAMSEGRVFRELWMRLPGLSGQMEAVR